MQGIEKQGAGGNVTLDESTGNFTFKMDEDNRLDIGEYLFVVYHTGAEKPFLRAILTIDGNHNSVDLTISPITEVKTQVYKQWVDAAPETATFANFEANISTANDTKIKEVAEEYEADLVVWAAKPDADKKTETVSTITVINIEVAKETKVKPVTRPDDDGNKTDDDFTKTLPTALKDFTWTEVTLADLKDHTFIQVYQKYDSKWTELVQGEIGSSLWPPDMAFVSWMDEETENEDIWIDIHPWANSVITWLIDQASNGKVNMPENTDNMPDAIEEAYYDVLYNGMPNAQFELSSDGKTFTIKTYTNPQTEDEVEELLSTTVYTIAKTQQGSTIYLYLKNQNSNDDFAERIFKQPDQQPVSRRR